MLSSIKPIKSVAYMLVCSLVATGLIEGTTLPANASHDAKPLQLATMPAQSGAQAAPKTDTVNEATRARISQAYANLPMSFEENRGLVDGQFKYLSRSSASTLYLSATEAVLVLSGSRGKVTETTPELLSSLNQAQPAASSTSVVRMKLHGANRSPRLSGESELRAKANYFTGNDPQKWHTDVPQYERVRYEQVYPGIDVIYYGQQQSLEYDFEVEAGADRKSVV